MKKRSIGDISENKVENLTILPYDFIFKREIKKLAATFCDDDPIDHNWGLSWDDQLIPRLQKILE